MDTDTPCSFLVILALGHLYTRFDGALSRLYALFAQASLPPWSKMKGEDIKPVEWDVMDNPFTLIVPIKPVVGQVLIPTGPGIGVELDQEVLRKYHWDGSMYS